MAFLSDLIASYLFEKSEPLLNRTTYHGIYLDDGLVVFNRNNSVQVIKWVDGVSENSVEGGVEPTLPVHHRNMDK